MTFNIQNIPADFVLISHLIMVAFLMIIFPYSKLLHALVYFLARQETKLIMLEKKAHCKMGERFRKNKLVKKMADNKFDTPKLRVPNNPKIKKRGYVT